jgi:MFS transporter, ACS family, tartrate transporter
VTRGEDFARTVPRRIALRLIPLLGLTYVLAHLDRVNVSFAALTMNADLGFSETVYGLGAGLFFLGYFLFEVPSNMALERVGARRLITTIMIVWGALSAAMAFIQDATQFYALRFALGVAEAGLYPGIMLYLTYWFRDEDRAGAVGLFALALAVAGVAGSPLSGAILDGFDGVGGLAGWQWLFIIEGLPTVGLAAVVWRLLPDRPAQAKWLGGAERAWLEDALSDAGAGRENTPRAGVLKTMLHPRVLALSMVYFLFLGAFAGTIFWSPKLVQAVGPQLSHAMVGTVVGLPYVLFAIAMVYWGRHSDRRGERRWHVASGALLAAAGYVVMALASDLTAMMAGLLLALTGAGAAFSCFWGLVMGALGGRLAAVGIATVNSAGALGSFLAVALLGRAHDLTGGHAAGIMGLAIAAACAAALIVAGKWTNATPVPATA